MGTTFKRIAAAAFDPGGIFSGAYQDVLYGGDDYDIQPPPESPYPANTGKETDTERDTALEKKRKKLQARNAARENFIATGGQGLLSPPETTKKTLLGK